MKKKLALLFALLVLVSCSETDGDAPSAAPSARETQEVARNDKKDAERVDVNDEEPVKKTPRNGRSGGTIEEDDGVGSPPDAGGSKGRRRSRPNDSSRAEDRSSAAHPAAGGYLYAQEGFEKFCAGGSCERQPLARRQNVRLTVSRRSSEGVTVVTEASSSDDRMLRTTTDYNRAGALITDVYTRLSYQGFAFENEYHPAPPVESLRFPLQDGAAWQGSWKDSTSGSYQVRVFGPTSVTVGGRAVRAFQVATTTQFRGEFNGEAKTLAWIDPATKAVVKISGTADLNSTYGRYVTEFSNALRSGPGY